MDNQTEGGNIPNHRYTSDGLSHPTQLRPTQSLQHQNPGTTPPRLLSALFQQISSLSNTPTAPLGLQPYKSTTHGDVNRTDSRSQKQLSWLGGWAFTVQNLNAIWLACGAPWFKYRRPARPLPRSLAGKSPHRMQGWNHSWKGGTSTRGGGPPAREPPHPTESPHPIC